MLNLRRCAFELCVRRWRICVDRCRSLPVPVTFILFLSDFRVFCFAMFYFLGRLYKHYQPFSFEPRISFYFHDSAKFCLDTFQKFVSEVLVNNLSSGEKDRNFYFITVLQEFFYPFDSDMKVMVSDKRLQTNFLDVDFFLFFPGVLFFFLLFVFKACKIYQSRYWRIRFWSYLPKIHL